MLNWIVFWIVTSGSWTLYSWTFYKLRTSLLSIHTHNLNANKCRILKKKHAHTWKHIKAQITLFTLFETLHVVPVQIHCIYCVYILCLRCSYVTFYVNIPSLCWFKLMYTLNVEFWRKIGSYSSWAVLEHVLHKTLVLLRLWTLTLYMLITCSHNDSYSYWMFK